MGAFEAIDELITTARFPLPAPGLRRRIRQQLHLAADQVAQACGADTSTLEAWEAGWEPAGAHRSRYVHFLTCGAGRLSLLDDGTEPAYTQAEAPLSTTTGDTSPPAAADGALRITQPCVLCGHPAHQQVAGSPQHLTPEDSYSTAVLPLPGER